MQSGDPPRRPPEVRAPVAPAAGSSDAPARSHTAEARTRADRTPGPRSRRRRCLDGLSAATATTPGLPSCIKSFPLRPVPFGWLCTSTRFAPGCSSRASKAGVSSTWPACPSSESTDAPAVVTARTRSCSGSRSRVSADSHPGAPRSVRSRALTSPSRPGRLSLRRDARLCRDHNRRRQNPGLDSLPPHTHPPVWGGGEKGSSGTAPAWPV